MNLLHAILLGLVQGLTEFLPVSSTAHLTMVENLLLGQSMPLAFDVLLHFGTLMALCVYFRAELLKILRGMMGNDPEGRRMAWLLFLAMIPTGILALSTKAFKEAAKGHIWVYGLCLFATAVLLYLANTLSKKREGRALSDVNTWDALSIGAIQGLGGGFGLSRSGSTISMGVFRGLSLPASARFSFLLGIPTIAAAAAKEGLPLVKALVKGQSLGAELAFPAGSSNPLLLCAVGVVVAALSGYAAVGLLDRFTRSPRLTPFAVYCLFAGALLVYMGL